MYDYDIEEKFKKKLFKLGKKDKVLALNFRKKIIEIINHNVDTINIYKNLRSPLNQYKRIHLTDKFILLFEVDNEKNKILFVDILHHNKAYSKK